MNAIDQIESNIKTLTIQGATNVALAVLDALENTLMETPAMPADAHKAIGIRLAYARPTEPLAQNAIRFIFANEHIQDNIQTYRQYIQDGKKSIPEHGVQLLVNGGNYLTICHSSTTIELFHQARRKGAHFSLFVAETRPRFQGRITAKELLSLGFDDVTMIIDDVAVSLIEGRKGKIDAVFVGADLLTHLGFANKVGSLAVTAAAARKNIPVYSLATLLKYDPRHYDPDIIETRDPMEIWSEAPEGLQFYAPAFDYVPYFPNVNIVCEAGVIPGTQVETEATTRYPFIKERNI